MNFSILKMADQIFDLNMNKYGMNSTAIAKRGGNIMEKLLLRQARRCMGANTGAKVFRKVGADM